MHPILQSNDSLPSVFYGKCAVKYLTGKQPYCIMQLVVFATIE